MGSVRPFVEDDIPQVARLHQTVFRTGDGFDHARLASYHSYFTRVFLDGPARDPMLTSLVYEDDGRIVGFVGVIPRRMTLRGRRYQAAVSSQFVVDPESPVGLVAVRLAKEFLDGPQDLSIADEANDVTRRIWEGLGGATSLLHSLHWTRPLRPARLALSFLRNRGGLGALATLGSPLAWAADAVATRMPRMHFYQSRPQVLAENLREDILLACLPDFAGAETLRMDYEDRTFPWLLERARRRRPTGRLQHAVLKQGQTILGWYICHVDRGAMAEVLQIAAKPSSIHAVLDHLFYQAWRQGAIAVTGRLEPGFMQALSDKYCLFHRRGPWMLVKARKPELTQSFQSGDAFFSRFDGEWCLGF